MKSIVVTYPSFQALPKGLKMLLVESEGFFFSLAGASKHHDPARASVRVAPGLPFSRIPFNPSGRGSNLSSGSAQAFCE